MDQCEEVQTRWYQEARGLAQADHLGVFSLMAGAGGGHIWNKSITEGPKKLSWAEADGVLVTNDRGNTVPNSSFLS